MAETKGHEMHASHKLQPYLLRRPSNTTYKRYPRAQALLHPELGLVDLDPYPLRPLSSRLLRGGQPALAPHLLVPFRAQLLLPRLPSAATPCTPRPRCYTIATRQDDSDRGSFITRRPFVHVYLPRGAPAPPGSSRPFRRGRRSHPSSPSRRVRAAPVPSTSILVTRTFNEDRSGRL